MTKTKSQIFREAWAKARNAASQFGGKARDYLSVCLRLIYAELRKVRQEAARSARKEAAIQTGSYEAMIIMNAPSTNVVSTTIEIVRAVAGAAVDKVASITGKTIRFFRQAFNLTTIQRPEEVALE